MSTREVAISVPESFAAEQIHTRGSEGRRWIDGLSGIVEQFCCRWGLRVVDATPRYGAHAVVVMCERGPEPCALKVGWNRSAIASEAAALKAWDGQGIGRLLEASPGDGVLLLERLDASRTLDTVDLLAAATVIGGLIRRLAIPAPPGFSHSDGWADLGAHLVRQQRALGNPLPEEWVLLASDLAVDLIGSAASYLAHTDLHSGNVLAGRGGEWVAIDPRIAVGDPERSAPDLLLWRLPLDAKPDEVRNLVRIMTSAGELWLERVRHWMVVRAVGHWLWCAETEAQAAREKETCTTCEPRCRRILEALT